MVLWREGGGVLKMGGNENCRKVECVYSLLNLRFGPQGWWPVTPKGGNRPAYSEENAGNLSPTQRWEVCVGAVLAQNTNWKNAEKAVVALNAAGIDSPKKIIGTPLPQLSQLIRPSGHHNQKAEKLRALAEHIVRHYGGNTEMMLAEGTRQLRAELLSIRGVGPETADSILLYALGKGAFVADAYTRRITQRVGLLDEGSCGSYEKTRTFFETNSKKEVRHYNNFHALLVRLAKEHCSKNNLACGACPLRKECGYAGCAENLRR
ncbi:hypothetical protein HY095_04995 [Candidatus Micrarchaeota archaeon]|nr:hypothetical protein [Candidatus Micrarchaeota archaeon]